MNNAVIALMAIIPKGVQYDLSVLMNVYTMTGEIINPASNSRGIKNRNTPMRVAAALPPLNPKYKGCPCPITAPNPRKPRAIGVR